MKILYIGMKYEYGLKQNGYSFEHYNFYDSLLKMNGGKNEITYFPFDEISLEYGNDKMNTMLLEKVKKERFDLLFFFLFRDEIKKETLSEIKDLKNGPTFNWFADDQWRFSNFSQHYAPLFDFSSTTAKTALLKYEKIGLKNKIIKTQWGCNHFLYKPVTDKKVYDISFVGQAHGNRKKFIKNLKTEGIEIACFGRGWSKDRISQDEMIKIFSQSKINLNLSNSSGGFNPKELAKIFINKDHQGLKLTSPKKWGDNFYSFMDKANNKQIKGRDFEITGCRGLLLTEKNKELEEFYEPDKEVVFYKNISDIKNKIDKLLRDKKLLEKIATAGYQRTLSEHTYEKRFNKIFKVILK